MATERDSKRGAHSLSVIEDAVPRRLRAERERRNLSLRELARRLHVSPSAISQIETGRARPSVSTLYAITAELGMSLDELFSSEDGEAERAAAVEPMRELVPPAPLGPDVSPVQHAGDRTKLELERGVVWERLTVASDPYVDFLQVTYPVGSASSPDETLMRHAGREYGLVTSGRLQVVVGFDAYELGAGDSISFDSSVPHRLSNVGDEPVSAVWFVVGRRVPDAR